MTFLQLIIFIYFFICCYVCIAKCIGSFNPKIFPYKYCYTHLFILSLLITKWYEFQFRGADIVCIHYLTIAKNQISKEGGGGVPKNIRKFNFQWRCKSHVLIYHKVFMKLLGNTKYVTRPPPLFISFLRGLQNPYWIQ